LRERSNVRVELVHRSLLAKLGLVTIPLWQEASFSAARIERYWG
jgi:hypothetical protein